MLFKILLAFICFPFIVYAQEPKEEEKPNTDAWGTVDNITDLQKARENFEILGGSRTPTIPDAKPQRQTNTAVEKTPRVPADLHENPSRISPKQPDKVVVDTTELHGPVQQAQGNGDVEVLENSKVEKKAAPRNRASASSETGSRHVPQQETAKTKTSKKRLPQRTKYTKDGLYRKNADGSKTPMVRTDEVGGKTSPKKGTTLVTDGELAKVRAKGVAAAGGPTEILPRSNIVKPEAKTVSMSQKVRQKVGSGMDAAGRAAGSAKRAGKKVLNTAQPILDKVDLVGDAASGLKKEVENSIQEGRDPSYLKAVGYGVQNALGAGGFDRAMEIGKKEKEKAQKNNGSMAGAYLRGSSQAVYETTYGGGYNNSQQAIKEEIDKEMAKLEGKKVTPEMYRDIERRAKLKAGVKVLGDVTGMNAAFEAGMLDAQKERRAINSGKLLGTKLKSRMEVDIHQAWDLQDKIAMLENGQGKADPQTIQAMKDKYNELVADLRQHRNRIGGKGLVDENDTELQALDGALSMLKEEEPVVVEHQEVDIQNEVSEEEITSNDIPEVSSEDVLLEESPSNEVNEIDTGKEEVANIETEEPVSEAPVESKEEVLAAALSSELDALDDEIDDLVELSDEDMELSTQRTLQEYGNQAARSEGRMNRVSSRAREHFSSASRTLSTIDARERENLSRVQESLRQTSEAMHRQKVARRSASTRGSGSSLSQQTSGAHIPSQEADFQGGGMNGPVRTGRYTGSISGSGGDLCPSSGRLSFNVTGSDQTCASGCSIQGFTNFKEVGGGSGRGSLSGSVNGNSITLTASTGLDSATSRGSLTGGSMSYRSGGGCGGRVSYSRN